MLILFAWNLGVLSEALCFEFKASYKVSRMVFVVKLNCCSQRVVGIYDFVMFYD